MHTHPPRACTRIQQSWSPHIYKLPGGAAGDDGLPQGVGGEAGHQDHLLPGTPPARSLGHSALAEHPLTCWFCMHLRRQEQQAEEGRSMRSCVPALRAGEGAHGHSRTPRAGQRDPQRRQRRPLLCPQQVGRDPPSADCVTLRYFSDSWRLGSGHVASPLPCTCLSYQHMREQLLRVSPQQLRPL